MPVNGRSSRAPVLRSRTRSRRYTMAKRFGSWTMQRPRLYRVGRAASMKLAAANA